ncbi:sorting nexin-31 [Gastrophryne carolinensis]
MHVSIPLTEELQDSFGGQYVLYSVYLEGFILFKVRYRDLHFWHERAERIFGNRLPLFPPKHYLAMTKSMAEERRTKLEHYLQEVISDPVVSSSEIFIEFFQKLQMQTIKMPLVKLTLNVYLPDGRKVQVDGQSSDTAERVLEASMYKLGLSRELKEYFSLFVTHKKGNGDFSVVKRIAHFEIPFITIWNINDDNFQIDIRKWYMDPNTDAMLMGCEAAIDFLYCQAVQELEMNWSSPTEEQRTTLQEYISTDNKFKFLELMQQVEHYGYLKLGPYPASVADTSSTVTFSQKLNSQPSEFKLEYQQGHSNTWITIWMQEAYLLSSCLKKILSEQPMTSVKEDLEILLYDLYFPLFTLTAFMFQ